ncbi:forkhead box protein J2 [Bombina bombina]|uniref:forkhead box protein J2 n=1 Tax=Bombina bombina TaxID=8345 RepID=UPI00235A7ABB|nr:forkhead box protein J2 [Bombina bombina]
MPALLQLSQDSTEQDMNKSPLSSTSEVSLPTDGAQGHRMSNNSPLPSYSQAAPSHMTPDARAPSYNNDCYKLSFSESSFPDLSCSFRSLYHSLLGKQGQSPLPAEVQSSSCCMYQQNSVAPSLQTHNVPSISGPPSSHHQSQHQQPPYMSRPPAPGMSLGLPSDWCSNIDSLKESFKIVNSLDWSSVDLSQFSDLMESLRQAELKNWSLDQHHIASLCDSLSHLLSQTGLLPSSHGQPVSCQAPCQPSTHGQPTSCQAPCLPTTHGQPSSCQAPCMPPTTSSACAHRGGKPSHGMAVNSYGQNQQTPASCAHTFTAPPGYPIQTQAPPTYTQQGRLPQRSLYPPSRSTLRYPHSNEDIQDDFDWDSIA